MTRSVEETSSTSMERRARFRIRNPFIEESAHEKSLSFLLRRHTEPLPRKISGESDDTDFSPEALSVERADEEPWSAEEDIDQRVAEAPAAQQGVPLAAPALSLETGIAKSDFKEARPISVEHIAGQATQAVSQELRSAEGQRKVADCVYAELHSRHPTIRDLAQGRGLHETGAPSGQQGAPPVLQASSHGCGLLAHVTIAAVTHESFFEDDSPMALCGPSAPVQGLGMPSQEGIFLEHMLPPMRHRRVGPVPEPCDLCFENFFEDEDQHTCREKSDESCCSNGSGLFGTEAPGSQRFALSTPTPCAHAQDELLRFWTPAKVVPSAYLVPKQQQTLSAPAALDLQAQPERAVALPAPRSLPFAKVAHSFPKSFGGVTVSVDDKSLVTSQVGRVCRVQWTTEAKKLRGSDKQVVSPPLQVCWQQAVEPATLKIILCSKGGNSFKKAGGVGYIQLKCCSDLAGAWPATTFSVAFGSGRDAQCLRGPYIHGFGSSSVFNIPKEQAEWDFGASVDLSTLTLTIIVEINLLA